MTRTPKLMAAMIGLAFALAACSTTPGMHKGDIPTDQNRAHDFHKSQGT